MSKIAVTITLATVYVVIYHVLHVAHADIRIILWMYFLSPLVLIAQAYVILKFGKPSGSTWKEKFYDDRETRRTPDRPG